MKLLPQILLAALLLSMPSCAEAVDCPNVGGETHGFLYGILHGLVFPFALIAKILGLDYDLYAHNNTGLFYWIGYLIGFGGIYGGVLRFRR